MCEKKEYTVAIEETIVQEFKINATSAEEAFEIAEKKYKAREIVLEDSEVQFVQMSVTSPCDEQTEWTEI